MWPNFDKLGKKVAETVIDNSSDRLRDFLLKKLVPEMEKIAKATKNPYDDLIVKGIKAALSDDEE